MVVFGASIVRGEAPSTNEARMHTRFVRPLAVVAVLAAASACATVPPATLAPEGPTTLLVMLGRDTLSVEQYTRTTSGIVGTMVSRSPFTIVSRYSVALGSDASPTSAEYSALRGDDTPIRGAV